MLDRSAFSAEFDEQNGGIEENEENGGSSSRHPVGMLNYHN